MRGVFDITINSKIRFQVKNGQNFVGLNYLWKRFFHNYNLFYPNWYLGLIAYGDGSPILSYADTMASHPTWTEFSGYNYPSEDRVEWFYEDEPDNGTLVTKADSVAVFSMTSTQQIAGIFLASSKEKNSTDGLLWATALFDSAIRPIVSDEWRINYSVAPGG